MSGHRLPARSVHHYQDAMPTRIVTYVHRYKRPPRKKKAVPLQVPAIVRNGRKRGDVPKLRRQRAMTGSRRSSPCPGQASGDRNRRREAADAIREKSPEELEEEARADAFLRRMMRDALS
jgi:hypothetical protein